MDRCTKRWTDVDRHTKRWRDMDICTKKWRDVDRHTKRWRCGEPHQQWSREHHRHSPDLGLSPSELFRWPCTTSNILSDTLTHHVKWCTHTPQQHLKWRPPQKNPHKQTPLEVKRHNTHHSKKLPHNTTWSNMPHNTHHHLKKNRHTPPLEVMCYTTPLEEIATQHHLK